MKERDPYDEPTTGSGDPGHAEGPKPVEPVNTGSGDPQHKAEQAD
ncbi:MULTISPECIES: hypothetical protein [Luteibacter]|jgi:hypothetical protein|nr:MULTISPECIES: hypothetical protein [Luteibacter]